MIDWSTASRTWTRISSLLLPQVTLLPLSASLWVTQVKQTGTVQMMATATLTQKMVPGVIAMVDICEGLGKQSTTLLVLLRCVARRVNNNHPEMHTTVRNHLIQHSSHNIHQPKPNTGWKTLFESISSVGVDQQTEWIHTYRRSIWSIYHSVNHHLHQCHIQESMQRRLRSSPPNNSTHTSTGYNGWKPLLPCFTAFRQHLWRSPQS